MPRRTKTTAVSPDAALVLTSPIAKPARKVSKSSPRAMHKRTAREATVATLRIVAFPPLLPSAFVLDINDVLTKNDRYRRTKYGQAESALAKAYKAAVAIAAARLGFVPPIKIPAAGKRKAKTIYHPATIQSGQWSLEVLSIWPTERHLDKTSKFAFGDADAPLSMVRDAMQRAGVIDDDMRIVSDRTHAMYEKGVRRTVAVLRPISAEAHAASVAAVLGVLG